ncbi:COG1835 Predicted acyltransferases [Candidatus Pelagibacterales bacterium]
MDYRREIDGLRALAILPVILFHAGFETFGGGFVGVDVFFVISGYLITTIILTELKQEKFSIINFYERRARRILPALFFLMLVCILFAWFWLLPIDMKNFSKSLVAVSIFASNIFFWVDSGYFVREAELKPLLHTWSLAVEEQFYILFPLFLMLSWKLGKLWILVTLGIAFFASLAMAEWLAYAKPFAAFYLLPTRGWELLIGAFSAFYLSQTNGKRFGRVTGEVGGWLGVALILFSVFAFSKTTPFPSFYTLVPTLGALLIILFATQRTTVGKYIGNKAFVGVGLISYSAYLWHQPLFAFARHRSLSEPSHVVFLALSAFALILAYFSWKLVESPFRKSGVITRKQIFALAFFFTLLFVILGYFGHTKNGFESRFNRILSGDIGHLEFHKYMDEKYFDCEAKSIAERALSWDSFLRCKQSQQGEPEIILLGDSHAEHLFLGLAQYIPNKNIAFYILSEKPYVEVKDFKHIFDEILNNNKSQHIILTMHFINRVDSQGSGLYIGFSRTIESLIKVGKSVTLVGNVPRFNQDPSLCVYSFSWKSSTSCSLSLKDVERQQSIYDDILKRLSKEFGLKYLQIYKDLCADDVCSMSKGDMILYRDNNHLNIIGSKLIGKSLAHRLSFK